jgi:hypothetical protein
MSWGAQNRSEDAKTPSVAGGRSEKPELDLWPVQPYFLFVSILLLEPACRAHAGRHRSCLLVTSVDNATTELHLRRWPRS